MIMFKCVKTDCPNYDVVYYFDTDVPVAECGGCQTKLVGEKTDIEPPTPLVPAPPKGI